MKQIFVFITASTILWGSCKEQTSQPTLVPKFALYLLSDSTITAWKASTSSLDSLGLSSTPLLTEADLKAYYWTTHTFVVTPTIDTLFSHMRRQTGKTFGVPFVVVAAGSRIYAGSFWWAYSSLMPPGCYIEIFLPPPYALRYDQGASMPDMRGDQRVREALRTAGILIE
jgi:hypothetical protein